MALKRDSNGWPLPPNGALSQWIRFFITVAVIPVVFWGVTLDRRVLTIENTRWRAADQSSYRDQVDLAISGLRLELSRIQGELDRKVSQDDAPPSPYRDEINRRFEEIIDRLRRLEGL